MNSEIAYALAALVCYGLGDFIYKRAASAGIAAEHFLMGQAWFFCPAIIAYAWITRTLDFEPPAWWGGLAGLFILIGFFNYVRSLRSGSVSIIAPVFRLNFIVTAALAIGWLGEPVTASKITGFVLALIANLVSAAVRLGKIGQTDGQKILAALLPRIRALAREAANSTLADLGGCAFRSDIAAMRHETQYSRLFRS